MPTRRTPIMRGPFPLPRDWPKAANRTQRRVYTIGSGKRKLPFPGVMSGFVGVMLVLCGAGLTFLLALSGAVCRVLSGPVGAPPTGPKVVVIALEGVRNRARRAPIRWQGIRPGAVMDWSPNATGRPRAFTQPPRAVWSGCHTITGRRQDRPLGITSWRRCWLGTTAPSRHC